MDVLPDEILFHLFWFLQNDSNSWFGLLCCCRRFYRVGQDLFSHTIVTQKRLQLIWMHLLHLERVGIKDRWEELGGDSLTFYIMLQSIWSRFSSQMTKGERLWAIKQSMSEPTVENLAILLCKKNLDACLSLC